MATPDTELARLKALDERRTQGADAWSPSRAREALRKFLHGVPKSAQIIEDADNACAMDNEGSFDDWCTSQFDCFIKT